MEIRGNYEYNLPGKYLVEIRGNYERHLDEIEFIEFWGKSLWISQEMMINI